MSLILKKLSLILYRYNRTTNKMLMNLFKNPSTGKIEKPQVSFGAIPKDSLKIKLTLVTPKEREKYRVPVYDYIL